MTRLRAAIVKEFDAFAHLETHAIDAYNDAHQYLAENSHLHKDEVHGSNWTRVSHSLESMIVSGGLNWGHSGHHVVHDSDDENVPKCVQQVCVHLLCDLVCAMLPPMLACSLSVSL